MKRKHLTREGAIRDIYETATKTNADVNAQLGLGGGNEMFSYTVSMEPDNKIFSNACALIDSQVEGAEKEKLLRDVDGSLIQRYSTPSGKIRVLSDYDVYAVYIESDVNLDQVLAEFSTSYGLQSWIKNQVDVLGNTNYARA